MPGPPGLVRARIIIDRDQPQPEGGFEQIAYGLNGWLNGQPTTIQLETTEGDTFTLEPFGSPRSVKDGVVVEITVTRR